MSKLLPVLLAIALIASACSAGENTNASPAGNAAAPPAKSGLSATAALPTAQAHTADAPKAVLDAIHQLAPQVPIQAVDKSPLPGLYQVIVQGQAVYVSADGRYMLQGDAW
ncbi:MAG TPA: disulfide isomerase DsbC N-terminal domain-containing protein, partial [Rhodanobacteraceae bacterium]